MTRSLPAFFALLELISCDLEKQCLYSHAQTMKQCATSPERTLIMVLLSGRSNLPDQLETVLLLFSVHRVPMLCHEIYYTS